MTNNRKCHCCGTWKDVSFSPSYGMYLCDDCFTEANDAREDEMREIEE